MLDFQVLSSYIFGGFVALCVYTWQGVYKRVERLERNSASMLSESVIDAKIMNAKNAINIELINLTNSLNNFVAKMDSRHERFEKIEKKFEQFLDDRKNFHDKLDDISGMLGTRQELLRALEAIEEFNLKNG